MEKSLKDFIKIKEKGCGIAYTHCGKFHADDVFCTALLNKIAKFDIRRVHKLPENIEEEAIVFDIGFGQFDHHSASCTEYRDNGIQYASFGKLWRVIWPLIVNKRADYIKLDEELVQCLDGKDTGTSDSDFLLTATIKAFNPPWYDEDPNSMEKAFDEAVQFASTIIDKHLANIVNLDKADMLVKSALIGAEMSTNPDIVILDKYAPWKNILIPSQARFVIYPSLRGNEYNAQTVPDGLNTKHRKCLFPIDWVDKSPSQLDKKVKGLRFCHKTRSLISTNTLNAAVRACMVAKGAKPKKNLIY